MIRRPSFLRRVTTRAVLAGLVLPGLLLTAACVQRFIAPDVVEVKPRMAPGAYSVKTPLKVHLLDGSTVVFKSGADIRSDRIDGVGQRFALLSGFSVPMSVVPMDSVVGVEAFVEKTLVAETLIVSAAATALGFLAIGGLAIAVFGSCPTVYADTPRGQVLEAEGFSYAISPLMEHRDLDALRIQPDAAGVIRLELRNEALETHFINQVEVVAVRHASDARVVPDQGGHPIAVSGFARVTGARDRAGRDVRAALAERDGQLFSSHPATIGAAQEGDLDDWIDLDVADLPPGDSLAVVLRMRNSLLNTVLLYEGMLGGRDAPDFLGNDLQHIGKTVDFARWYVRTMGMRLSVDGVPLAANEPFEGHGRLGDIGPIAFRDVAVVLPRPRTDAAGARVRLRFVADNWRIDEVRVAGALTRPEYTTLAVDSVIVPTPAVGTGPVSDTAAVVAIADADEGYLETRPGQRMTLVFHPDAAAAPDTRSTYLIAWQGWYREWIRPGWLAEPKRTEPFVPGDAAVLTALRSWTSQKDAFESAFYSTSIPVR
jgi:hypothetical protein